MQSTHWKTRHLSGSGWGKPKTTNELVMADKNGDTDDTDDNEDGII